MKKIFHLYWMILIAGMLAGCGHDHTATNPPVTTAVLKLSTQGALGGSSLSGIGITITLPDGVTVKTNGSGVVDASVVTVSGVAVPGSVIPPVYTPATGSTKATLAIVVASSQAAGFGVGEFATITCDIASGAFPAAIDFSLKDFTPSDLFLSPVAGLTASFTADIH